MKINPKYGDKIIALPSSQVLDCIKEASEADMKVLVFALANTSSTADGIASALGITKDEVKTSLLFWKERGAISVTGLKVNSSAKSDAKPAAPHEEKNESAEAPQKIQLALISYGIPTYRDEEIEKKLRKIKELPPLIDECNEILGTVMNTYEAGIIVSLYDYLKLSKEYIMLLCHHCASQGKTSLHYVKKVAENLVGKGITEYGELEEYYNSQERVKTTEGKVRRLFGMGRRALTPKEKEAISMWTEWALSDEMLSKAYEISVNNTSEPNIKYMHKVISNWYENGVKTPDEADRASEQYRKTGPVKKLRGKTGQRDGGSFDTKEFFEAALQRSYLDDNK